MKKHLIIAITILAFSGCNMALSPEEMIQKSLNPFKEYKINDIKVANLVEKGILETEVEKRGLDISASSAHLISYTKIGTYGKGEVRIMGELTSEEVEKINKKYKSLQVNKLVSYTATFEYSEKTGRYTWISNYPYN